jgi:O-antigen/teichoic acid export membrane protein
MGAVFPVLSMLAGGGRERLAVAYEKSYRMLAIIAVPLSIGIALTSDLLVRATPHAFVQSIPALRILSISVAFLFVNNAFVYTLTAMNRQADFTRLTLVALVVNLALNFALIPPYGYQGAAVAATLTEVCLFVGGWWLVRQRLYGLPAIRTIARVLLAGLLMGAAIVALHSTSLLLIVPAAAAVYVVSLLLLRALDPMEIQIVRQAFRAG